ncbi:hypothetical protein [Microbispora sp. ATCC PTA-5024]|nr:hypothetical protein [Microbispora sp. ATCC PTA-5024]
MRKVDPESNLPYSERLKCANNAKTAYYEALARKARKAKAAKKAAAERAA